MCLATNLVRRNATYYIRARVPKDLTGHMGKEEVWKSLRTKDPQEAKRLLPAAMTELHALFDGERAKRDHGPGNGEQRHATPQRFTTEQLQGFALDYYRAELATDEGERLHGTDPTFAALRQRSAELQRRDLGMSGNFVHVHHAADAIFERLGWTVRPPADEDPHAPQGDPARPVLRRDDPAYRELCMWLMRAKAETNKRFAERDQGDYGGTPADPVLKPSPAPAPAPSRAEPEPAVVVALEGETLAELHGRYLAERQDITPEWAGTNRAIIRLFIEHVGARKPVTTINKRDVREWKSELLHFPSRGTLRGDRGTFKEIVARNKREKLPAVSARTINKYLSALRQFGKWLEDHDYIEANFVPDDMSLPEGDDQDKRDPFTVAQLAKLFKSPAFTGCKSKDSAEQHLPGNVRLDDSRYWVPLLALWTGARLGELLQLQVSDVQTLSGVVCININTIGGKRVKRKASKRIVPVHSHLKRLGFLDFVERRKGQGADRLFPEIEPDALGRISSNYSKAFAKYMKRIGVKTDERLTFHSFRHSFADQMRVAGYPDATIAAIIGQSNATVTASYGGLSEFGPKERAVMVESVKYDGLDLSHLHP
ncbi:site-specific integrase [Roseomonas genomospecies 6]|uniref:Site-specific integrase n=1 Tax=Roseomonas genomospecies 6 TaxID=214106 RepID=A0A9W7KQY7_9PROT|nr:site-specific integrase [Roseomonas genomospecies 6]KAA0677772.1 hypothetical protein DS843_21880 [Roseomonas genomospecies 6]